MKYIVLALLSFILLGCSQSPEDDVDIKTKETPVVKAEEAPVIKAEETPVVKTEETPIIKAEEPFVIEAAEPPVIVAVETLSKNAIDITFSEPVTVIDISATESLGTPVSELENTTLHVTFPEAATPGTEYEISGAVVNAGESTLDFTIPFTGYNDGVPDITLNEIRATYSKGKAEYIELYAATAGNLAGVTVYCASSSRDYAYTFPAVEVPAGSFIVLHMRNSDNAFSDDLTGPASGTGDTESREDAYDFWFAANKKVLHNTDVILLERSNGGDILDALLMCEGTETEWGDESLEEAALAAVTAGKWKPDATVVGAAKTSDTAGKKGLTTTRTLGKIAGANSNDTATSWTICPDRKATPGSENWSEN